MKGTPRLHRSTTCDGNKDGLGMIMNIKIIVVMVKRMMTRWNNYNEYNHDYCLNGYGNHDDIDYNDNEAI